ncbi:MAG: DNA (cytosine-5-)-methyltransferase [Anaerolineae bacterium]|nr:DNA (cytosine-5-)-methyltransferase [Anaerolineae bacterium]
MPKVKDTEPKKYHPTSHGPEIFPRRPPVLTSAEMQWREEVVAFLQKCQSDISPELSSPSSLAVIKERPATYKVGNEASSQAADSQPIKTEVLRERLIKEILVPLRIINEILKVQFGSPELGNQQNLIDELVYILLTRRSKIEDAEKQLRAIKKKYATWEEVALTPPDELKSIIMGGGLEDHKVQFIQGSLRLICQEFGRIDEADFANMSDWQLDQFLQKLPGVGKKTAACILMYVRGMDIFPADTHCLRVLDRLGIFKNFGFAWRQEDHKKAQEELPLLLMPPHIRNDLHRNLVVLGKEICKQTPECDRCELKKFCAYYRTKAQAAHTEEKKSLAIDMFCGAGGFSLGLSRAGFKIVAAIDNNPDAIRTYRLNHPEIPDEAIIEDEIQSDARRVKLKQLRNLLKGQELDLLVGGPPCQGYSMMGNRVPHKYENGDKSFGSDYRFTEDKRNHLFKAMLRVARELKPRYVVIENVPGLGSASIKKEKTYADHIAESLERLGYQVKVCLLEAVNFYIPQNRHRFFIFGTRQGEPIPNLEKFKQNIQEGQMTTLKHALYDLPRLSVSDGQWVAAHSNGIGRNIEWDQRYLERFQIRGNTHILFNHVSRFNNEDDVRLYSELKEGETYQDLVSRIGMTKQFFKNYEVKNFHDKYYRLQWEGQSKTIVSHLHKDGNSFVHPDPDRQIRSLSVREAARIQSFPDDYIFCGSRGAQFIQIGNAVPPIMAQAIGEVLVEAIKAQENEIDNE